MDDLRYIWSKLDLHLEVTGANCGSIVRFFQEDVSGYLFKCETMPRLDSSILVIMTAKCPVTGRTLSLTECEDQGAAQALWELTHE